MSLLMTEELRALPVRERPRTMTVEWTIPADWNDEEVEYLLAGVLAQTAELFPGDSEVLDFQAAYWPPTEGES